ncbi:DUF1254 domain-containing protein [Algoriphagus lacus]|uniref:DUF1254 domain-containing protein n=1 Tax=Algoriphagus lacus TaxID=2056311 RepID=A0A418PR61_9BACT|nr:DUF1254 domain-containing protein [Algoriphagus lacus]RIW15067.1 DUF1254 domain-containing protein [Algoriphagus lacus]
MVQKSRFFLLLVLGILLFTQCQKTEELNPSEAREIAKKAFIYGFPLVMNYKALYANAIDKNSGDYKGDFNEKSCEARLFSPEDKAIVTPNSDTPYCMFWSDIRNEPLVLSVPEVDPDRYYSFQLVDLYTHNFFYIGSLTTGNKAGNYLIANQNWKGEIPEGITQVVRCETGLFFTIIRTQLLDANDLDNVKKLQNEYQVQTLNEYLGKAAVENKFQNVFPEWVEGDQFTEASFRYFDAVVQFIEPIEKEDSLFAEFAKLGIGTKQGFELTSFNPEIQEAIKKGVSDGFEEMNAFIKSQSSDPLGSSKIFGTREFLEKSAKENYGFDDFYLLRAVGAFLGIYGNSAQEATYPMYLTDHLGESLDASKHKYTLTFESGQLPPVQSFWSLTMYDGKTQLLVDNSLNKYLISSTHLNSFVKNKDGSITFYIQSESPGKALESNWLPAPSGPFYAVMRLYGPKEEVLQGKWVNPKMIANN